MQKINILIILRDHLSTLTDDNSGKISWLDIGFFYCLPIALGVAFYLHPIALPSSIEGALIAVFSVFGALLFSAQVALYSLSPSAPDECGDPIQNAANIERARKEKNFFKDVNYNVSYLILLSCIFLILFIALMVASASARVEGAVLTFAVTHFFLSLLMLVKRSHVAFSLRHSDEI